MLARVVGVVGWDGWDGWRARGSGRARAFESGVEL